MTQVPIIHPSRNFSAGALYLPTGAPSAQQIFRASGHQPLGVAPNDLKVTDGRAPAFCRSKTSPAVSPPKPLKPSPDPTDRPPEYVVHHLFHALPPQLSTSRPSRCSSSCPEPLYVVPDSCLSFSFSRSNAESFDCGRQSVHDRHWPDSIGEKEAKVSRRARHQDGPNGGRTQRKRESREC